MGEPKPNWIKLQSLKLNPVRHENVSGTDVEVAFSPYDVPDAARGYRDQANNCYVFEFRYISGDEPLEATLREEGVKVWTGKNSHRVYSLMVDASNIQNRSLIVDTLRTRLGSAIEKVASIHSSTARSGNYKVTRDVLDSSDGVELLRKAVA